MNCKEILMECVCNISKEKEIKWESDSLNLVSVLGFDSIDFINLIVDVEDELNIELDDELLDFDKLSDFDYLCRIVEKQLNL